MTAAVALLLLIIAFTAKPGLESVSGSAWSSVSFFPVFDADAWTSVSTVVTFKNNFLDLAAMVDYFIG